MKRLLTNVGLLFLLAGLGTSKAFTQTKKSISSCKQSTFAVFKPLPKLAKGA